VKANGKPPMKVSLDQMVVLTNVECRKVWKNSAGHIPEESVVVGIAENELALNFPNTKRKRAPAIQCLARSCGFLFRHALAVREATL